MKVGCYQLSVTSHQFIYHPEGWVPKRDKLSLRMPLRCSYKANTRFVDLSPGGHGARRR